MKLNQKELQSILHYDSETGIFTWLISRQGIQKGLIAGTEVDGYIIIRINQTAYKAHRLAWLYEYGYFPENDIDHKDRIRHHNWIKNLREASRSCNQRNSGVQKNNTSGVKGVHFQNSRKKWVVQIKIITLNSKQAYLGSFVDFDEAVCHRLAAEQCLNWNECDSSSLAYQYVNRMISDSM